MVQYWVTAVDWVGLSKVGCGGVNALGDKVTGVVV